MMRYLILMIKGFCMGVANIIPGVSGGTMAFILGIYMDLIKSIKSFDLNFLKLLSSLKIKEALAYASWRFLGAVVLGALIATFTLSKVLKFLLQDKTVLIYSFFFGLIIASIWLVGKSLKKWTLGMVVWLLLSALGAYVLVGLVPVSTPDSLWFLFLCAAIAICAMILPGISGAFILLLLGKYAYVLEAINNRDFIVLGVFALGACVGIISFVRFLNWLLSRYYNLTIVFLTGLMMGSLRKIWPWKETIEAITDPRGKTIPLIQINIMPAAVTTDVMLGVALIAGGFFIALSLEYYSKNIDIRKNGNM